MAQLTIEDKGKTYIMPWDLERDPTDAEIDAFIASQGKPESPGYLSGLKESWEGLKQFGSDVLTSVSPLSPGSHEASRRVVGGVVDPFVDAAKRELELQGQMGTRPWTDIQGDLAKHRLRLVSDVAGVTPAIEAAQQGEYARAAGLATIPVAGAALGGVKPIRAARKANKANTITKARGAPEFRSYPPGVMHGPELPQVPANRLLPSVAESRLPTETPITDVAPVINPLPTPKRFIQTEQGIVDLTGVLPVELLSPNITAPPSSAVRTVQAVPTERPNNITGMSRAERRRYMEEYGERAPEETTDIVGPRTHSGMGDFRYQVVPDRTVSGRVKETVESLDTPADLTSFGITPPIVQTGSWRNPPAKPPKLRPVKDVPVENRTRPLTDAELGTVEGMRTALAQRRAAREAKSTSKSTSIPEVVSAPKVTSVPQAVVNAVSKIDELNPVTPEQASKIVREITEDSGFRDIYDRGLTSVSTQLSKIAPKIGKLFEVARTEGNQLGGQYATPLSKLNRKMSKSERLLTVRILDGKASINDTTPGIVKLATIRYRKALDEVGDMGEASGIHITTGDGESIPFKKRLDYFPHVYPEGYIKKNKKSIVNQLVEQGMTAEQAHQLVERSRKFGESYISPQHARAFNVPGYIEDLDVVEKYLYDMTERVTRAKYFGVKDTADPNSPISKLVNASSNPEKARRLAEKLMDREKRASEGERIAAQKLVNFEVLTKLSKSALNQLGDLAGVPVRTGFKNFASGLYHTLTRYMDSKDLTSESGGLAIMKGEILKDLSHSQVGKYYGLSKTEEVVRTVSAMSGRAAVQDIFNKLKKNPNQKYRRAELKRLLDKDVDTILKQDKLTPEQIQYASARTVELINSIPDKYDLPPAFTHPNPLLRIPLLFKRYTFTTTRNLIRAINEDPRRVIPAIISYGLVGEVVGDAKTALDAALRGDFDEILEDIANRDKDSPLDLGNRYLNRGLANLTQAWFFELLSGAMGAATGGARKVAGYLGGPVLGDVMEASDIGAAAKADLLKKEDFNKSDLDPIKKAIVRRIPFVGSSWAEEMKKKPASGTIR